jgi:sodium transport system permease protein
MNVSPVWVVIAKEIIDNLRDRQTLFYALLFGPVLLPLLLGGSLAMTFKQLSIDFDSVTTLPVRHADRAPELMRFLEGQNVDAVAAPEDPVDAVAAGDVEVVLEIGEQFGEQLREARPAALTLYLDESDKASMRAARRVETLLGLWEQTNNSLRLQHRGLDPTVFDSLDLVTDDVSNDGASGQLLASLLPFLFIVSMTMGGFYLAIDTTAGERERRSLEPLLGLPIARRDIVIGKFGATLAFVTLSVILCAFAVWALFRVFPADLIGGEVRFDASTVTRGLLLALPLAPFIAALLVTVSAWTRSVKEAQTYLGLLMVIPMAPFFALQFLTVRSEVVLMPWPMLSQYLLLERSTLGLPLPALDIVLSVLGTLAASAALVALACALYRRERILA